MSSSNLIEVTLIEEAIYGTTPGAGNFDTARYTSESLSGTPDTTESQQIRTDRMSNGQVAVGLTVGGDLNYELAKEDVVDKLFESLMLSTFQASVAVNVDLTLDVTAKTLDRAAGDFNADVKVGEIITLAGFVNTVNNVQVMVTEIVDADTIKFVGPDTMVDEVIAGATFKVSDRVDIGITKKSFSMQKKFLDLTDKAIVYRGQLVSNASLNVAHGEISSGTFSFNGNDYKPVDAAVDMITDGRTVNAAATSESMNGSIDMPFIATSSTGVFDEASFCIQSVELSINNNYTPQNCIGTVAPKDYSPGTAQIEVSISAYLADDNWALIAKKLSQEPFSLGFMIKNAGGYYGFFLPAVQVSFEDPSSGGANQDVILSMSGTAKVGASGESAITIFKS